MDSSKQHSEVDNQFNQFNQLKEGPSRARWLLPSVEAVTAIMCSAAPLNFKNKAACAAFVDHSMASGAWLTTSSHSSVSFDLDSEKPSVLANESEDEELKAILGNSGLNDLFMRQLRQAGKECEQTLDPIIIRSFNIMGFLRDFVAAPLVSRGRVAGVLTCLFRVDKERGDQELQAVEIIARIFAMALQENLVNTRNTKNLEIIERDNSADKKNQGYFKDERYKIESIVRCLPGSILSFDASGLATESMTVSALGQSTLVKNTKESGWRLNFTTQQSSIAQKNAVDRARKGEQTVCQFQVNDWKDDDRREQRIIEHIFGPVKNDQNEVVEVIAYAHDVTDKMATLAMSEKLKQIHERDAVTDCMTISALRDQCEKEIADQPTHQTPLVFYTIEIEKSGAGMHLLGQSSFEELLQTVVARIRRQLPQLHIIARRGDHSFVAMARLEGDEQAPHKSSQKIIEALSEPIVTGRHEYFIATNVGHSVYPRDGDTIDEMLYNSDIAAVVAAKEKVNVSYAFAPKMAHEANERVRIETALHRAVDHDEFKMAYQPKVDMVTGQISGVEALIRWPGRNNISPAQFIPIAEECGLISFVGQWAMREACRTVVSWSKKGHHIPVSVNVSTRQFQDQDFNSIVKEILRDTQCDPNLLEIEVTEGVMIRDPQAAMESFKELKKLGIMLSIDDFGTGYSSLAYLKELPVDKLKIDRAFVLGLPHDNNSKAIVKAILAMSKAMNLRTVAEGVEDFECLDYLRCMGCDEIQGYYFSKPLFENDFMAWYGAYESIRKTTVRKF